MIIDLLRTDPTLFFMLMPILIFSLCVHEFAHARVALAFNDQTAYKAGRVTLNPLVHLDFFGTILLLTVGIGWAKPVPVIASNLKPRKIGNICVSLAGVTSNFLLVLICALLLKLALMFHSIFSYNQLVLLVSALRLAIAINIMLAIFNLLPIYPLDGHHVARELLPSRKQAAFMKFQRETGIWILIGLLYLPDLLGTPDPIFITRNWLIGIVDTVFNI